MINRCHECALSIEEQKNFYVCQIRETKEVIMKLWKVSIKTYYFGNYYYVLFVLANDEESMKQTVRNHPRYKRDEDAEIDSYEEIDLENLTNRVL